MAGKFWSSPETEPKRAFRFYISLGAENSAQIESYAVKTVKKPSFAVSETPHQFVAHTFYFPGRITWNTIDVTFVDPVEPDQTVLLYNMLQKAGFRNPVTEEVAKISLSKQGFTSGVGQIQIHQISAANVVIETWQLINPFFTSVDFGQLDYSSEELIVNTVTIRYDYAKLTKGGTGTAINNMEAA